MNEPLLLPAGEGAALVDWGGEINPAANDRVRRLHRRLETDPPRGYREAVPAFSSLLVYFDPLAPDAGELPGILARLAREAGREQLPAGREWEVPAVYGGEYGPDLAALAARAGLAPDEVAAIHAGRTYRVYMLGFLAGFPYLASVPDRIATPRRADPRLRVPAGSIGIAGRQTGIYPVAAPGGWQLVARTPLRLWDPFREPPALFRAGDRVRFRPVAAAAFDAPAATPPPPASGRDVFRVLAAGPLTTVQDRGRAGQQACGVPPGGALDDVSLRVANRLAGNPAGAAALEITGGGLRLEAVARVAVALGGGDLQARVNDVAFPGYTRRVLEPGDRLTFDWPRAGVRAYLAVEGGLGVPPVLGSRSTCLAAGFGGFAGRPLRVGDVLPAGPGRGWLPPAAAVPARLCAGAANRVTLRLTPGPQAGWLAPAGWERLLEQVFTVGRASDRMGLRLEGEPLADLVPRELISEGVPPGALQVPPSGQPILLLADRQTTGGYPKPAVLAAVDLPVAAQLPPGAKVRFTLIGADAARTLLEERERLLAAWAGRAFRLCVDGRSFDVTVEELD